MKKISEKEFDLHGNEDDINKFLESVQSEDEETAERILTWAQHVCVQHGMVRAAMQGLVDISWEGEEPRFHINEAGTNHVENLLGLNWPDHIEEKTGDNSK